MTSTMPVEPGLLDTNILAYAIDADASQNAASRALLEAARDPSVRLYVTAQIICEFYSVITNPKRVAKVTAPADAVAIISPLLALPGLHVLPTPPQTVQRLIELLQQNPVSGAGIFDLQIVATMQANDIDRIYTFDRGFQEFSKLSVVTPAPYL
jgi:predicted nucleic acid-binding protein